MMLALGVDATPLDIAFTRIAGATMAISAAVEYSLQVRGYSPFASQASDMHPVCLCDPSQMALLNKQLQRRKTACR
jgi:hypothetical protein